MKNFTFLLLFTILLVLFLGTGMQVAYAATFLVTKTADTNDVSCNEDCSLLEAIAAANSQSGDDTINFDPMSFPLGQTITLALGELIVSNNGALTIEGPRGNWVKISADNRSHVFYINQGAQVTVIGLVLADGNGSGAAFNGAGGGIFNNGGVVTTINSVFRDNRTVDGAAIMNKNGGKVSVIHSTIINNKAESDGGAIRNIDTGSVVNIINSTISGNSAARGGAIYNMSTLIVTNSTITDNTAERSGGGIVMDGLFGGTAILNNATVSNNRAGIDAGGIGNYIGTVTARNTIVADNTTISGTEPDFAGTLSSLGNNLIENTNGTFITGNTTGNITGQDPLLGTLGSYGGPTLTRALLSGSPAVDAGNNCVTLSSANGGCLDVSLTTDQRGPFFSRRVGTNVDIGAFEVQAQLTLTGRVLTGFGGKPIGNAVITMRNRTTGETLIAASNPFGYYRFSNVQAGQQYEINVRHKKHSFPSRTLGFLMSISNFDFYALEFSFIER